MPTFKFQATFDAVTGRVSWAVGDQFTRDHLRQPGLPGRPRDVDAKKDDTFVLIGVDAIEFVSESPFPISPLPGGSLVYLAVSGAITQTVAVQIDAADSPRSFRFKCAKAGNQRILGLDQAGDEIVVVFP
jgi:hypothetical protein